MAKIRNLMEMPKLLIKFITLSLTWMALLGQAQAQTGNAGPSVEFPFPWQEGNSLETLHDGQALSAARHQMLEAATHSIYLSTFSISPDHFGKGLADVLCQKAKLGLDVRIMIDHRANKDFFKYSNSLKKCGAYVIHFRPGSRLYALHEKLLIIDGNQAIVGGSGYTRTYDRARPDSFRREKPDGTLERGHGWYDIDFKIAGPTACALHNQYRNNFIHMVLQVADYNPDMWWYGWDNFKRMIPKLYGLGRFKACLPTATDGEARAIAIIGNPYKNQARPILQAHLAAVDRAIAKNLPIKLYSPYFVPPQKLVAALVKAREAGIPVTFISNTVESSDEGDYAKAIFVAMVESTKSLRQAGAEIYLWNKKSMLHRKGGVYGDVAFFGSDNLDNRAQEWQSESVVFTDYGPTVAEMLADFDRDQQNTIPLTNELIRQVWDRTPLHLRVIGKKFKHYF